MRTDIKGGLFINCLDLKNIEKRFSDISGVTEGELALCADFITSGKKYVEDRLSEIPDGEDRVLCEYCAACAANYSYVCARLSRERSFVTSAGLYAGNLAEVALKESARELFVNAKAQTERLFSGSFVFKGVE